MTRLKPTRPPEVTVVGHITEDLVAGELRPGGSALYCALALAAVNARVRVVTRMGAGSEGPSLLEAAGVEYAIADGATTRFRLEYPAAGPRKMWLERKAAPLSLADVPESWRRPDLLLIVPVIGEVEPDVWHGSSAQTLAFGVQGWLKQATSSGLVQSCAWPGWTTVNQADLVSMSEEDLEADRDLARSLTDNSDVVMVTASERGCRVLSGGERHSIPALETVAQDPTGAGDTFLALAALAVCRGESALDAAIAGTAAASLVVEGDGATPLSRLRDELEGRVERVRELAGHR